MPTNPNQTDEAFEDQEEYEEIVEIDEHGNVYKPGEAPRSGRSKPTILRDPKGEFSVTPARFQMSRDLIFAGEDLSRPRWAVEREKMKAKFPGFSFFASDGKVSSVQGYLSTSYGNTYYVKVEVSSGYPYDLPRVNLPYETLDPKCPHRFTSGAVCIMKSDQWTSSFSLAFVVAKAAIWLNKYDSWKRNGKVRWPGKEQPH
jgi:ubiquitin-protein ligase